MTYLHTIARRRTSWVQWQLKESMSDNRELDVKLVKLMGWTVKQDDVYGRAAVSPNKGDG